VYGHDRANRLFEDMNALIIHSLKACQNVMINDKHCFECYGYDLLIDAQLKPWLLEVNASPSLTTTTTADRVLKTALISDLLDIVMPAGLPVDVAHKGMTTQQLEIWFQLSAWVSLSCCMMKRKTSKAIVGPH